VANHLEALGDVLQLLGHIVAELAQLAAAIGTAVTLRKVADNFAREMFRQRLASRSRLRFLSRCHPLNSGFLLGLRGLQLFQMEFELFELNNDLLALDAEHPAPQLLDDQLQMLDLLAAGTQFLALVVSVWRCSSSSASALERLCCAASARAFGHSLMLSNEQRLQRFDDRADRDLATEQQP
jgi:hypothetical protein